MAAASSSSPALTESPAVTVPGVRIAGSKPPAWALVDFRDDRHSEPDRQELAATAPALVTDGPASRNTPALPSKPPSMSSPRDFQFVKELGCGSWSTVMEAVHVGTEKRFAVKILSKSQLIKQKKVKYATVEKDALAKLSGNHPGIVKMYAAFQDETSLYFVLELAPHGDLADLVKKYGSLSLRCAQWYTAQIVDSVLWMHSKGIVHRDLKPENVLLDEELRVKLTDFGSAYIAPDGGDLSPRSSTFVGSAAYVSPELLNRASKTTSSSSDIWAIGCTVFFMIAGYPAFAAINDYQSFRKIEALDYTFPEGFYDTAQDLIKQLLVLDPADRLGVEPKSSPSQLREHPFFCATRWESLWTDPPPAPETGIVPPLATAIAEEEDDDLWNNVVHEFSLVNLQSPKGGSLPTTFGGPPGPPIDVPPDVVPCEVVEMVQSDTKSPATTDGNDNQELEEGCNDVGKDWSDILGPGETVRRSAFVSTAIRKGLLKQTRSCALLLTSRPRLLCVLLDEKQRAPKRSDIKHSLVFRGAEAQSPPPPKGEKQDIIVACRSGGPTALVLQCADKVYIYDFSDEASTHAWTREVSALISPR